MRVLTAAQMREVDRRTSERGIPGLVLMENAGCRVVEAMERRLGPLAAHRVVVLCGKGNNGGDGYVIARQLLTRVRPASLHVVTAVPAESLTGDAAQAHRMWLACGGTVHDAVTEEMRRATLVVDALLGTGLRGPANGRTLELIRECNRGFPLAVVVAVDLPSGLPSDGEEAKGEFVRAGHTVTFTAPKWSHVLPPNCDRMGTVDVEAIGSPADVVDGDPDSFLSLSSPAAFGDLLRPRDAGGHKGTYGHVLVVGGSPGKTGAPAMSGMAALRSGAGLVTVAVPAPCLASAASFAPELMTEPLPASGDGALAAAALPRLLELSERRTLLAIGPGLGTHPETAEVVRHLFAEFPKPMVLDADALNALADQTWEANGVTRILTPHPGEMARLAGTSTEAVQADRVGAARRLAQERRVTVVLKGQRTLVALPDGRVWVNPTGTPAMGTGGTGDILTGMIAGLLAQWRHEPERATLAAVYLHGLAGERGAAKLGEMSLVATDLLRYLPEAIRAAQRSPDGV